ncbi:MAG: M14 family zinc carboxypeptidase [Tepidisphaeraceae bacterium]
MPTEPATRPSRARAKPRRRRPAQPSARPGPPILSRSPNSEEVRERILLLQSRKPDLVSVRTVMHSTEGRSIDAVTITDLRQADLDKQHVLVAAGQHGNEESARLAALKLLDYLLSPDGRPLLRKQKIVVMPNVSPDAAERDTYETPAGIKPNLDHPPTGATSPEGRALERVAEELAPEVYVDMHARGHAGWSHDMVLFPPTRPYTEDENLLYEIARAMAVGGEKSGIPHVVHPLSWPGWGGPGLDQPSSTLYAYRRFKSLVFLTENAEHNEVCYPARMRASSGVNRLKPLLVLGNRRHPCLPHSGYPCAMAVGMFHAGAVAVGANAAERRASRVELWRAAESFKQLAPALPERPRAKTLQVKYDGAALQAGVGFQVRIAGRWLVHRVRVNGKSLRPGGPAGYCSWHDKHTTFAVAAVPTLAPGEHEIDFTFQ